MSKIIGRNKLKLIISLSIVLLNANTLSAAPKKTKSLVDFGIQEAKELFLMSLRKASMERLDRLKSQARTKTELKRIQDQKLLFAEQFLTTKSFQEYVAAKSFAELELWGDCLKSLGEIKPDDQDNLLVLRQKAQCQRGAQQLDQAEKTLGSILELFPKDVFATLELAEIYLSKGSATKGLEVLSPLNVQTLGLQTLAFQERYALVKARLLEASDQALDALEVLKKHHEEHVENVKVIFELGMLYSRLKESTKQEGAKNKWNARKYLSLFLSRCKRLDLNAPKNQALHKQVAQAQSLYTELEKQAPH